MTLFSKASKINSPEDPFMHHHIRSTACIAAFLLSSLGWSAAQAATTAPVLAPHRAIYDMSLGEVRSGSSMTGVAGRMVYEFSGSSCEGYTLNMRLVTRISDRQGEATITDLRSSTWEQGEGKEFRFTTTQYFDEKVSETTSGHAVRTSDGRIKLKLEKPVAVELELPPDTLFPTQHSLRVLEAAEAGRNLVQTAVYDGSEKGQKVYATTTFIGSRMPPGTAEGGKRIANDEPLRALSAWPISISYFDSDASGDVTPTYQLTFTLYANGVSRDIEIDYGDFVLKGVLKSIEFLPVKPCR